MDEFTSSGESLEESGFDRRANRDKSDRDFDGILPPASPPKCLLLISFQCYLIYIRN